MEIAQTTIINNNNTTTTPPKPSSLEEHETETPTRILNTTTTTTTTKALTFSNGVLKRHNNHVAAANHHHHHQQVFYKECLKNHAATLGGLALDGCGEFMPAPTATSADPTSLKCAACGCHRNFHRREPEDPLVSAAIEFQSYHRHQPLPPPPLARSPNSASPPPISSSYYHHHPSASAPHMLLALSSAGIAAPPESTAGPLTTAIGSPRKRFRTKFSQEQKEKMQKFAEKVGWKMQKRDDDLVREFCNDVGVDRGVLKVWMHNNKNTFSKRENGNGDGNGKSILEIMEQDPNNTIINNGNTNDNHNTTDHDVNLVAANASSSS